MALLGTLVDSFDGAALNTALWNASTGGAVSVDAVNDMAVLACPTTAGAFNSLGSAGPWDARGQSVYAKVVPVPKGAGGTLTQLVVVKDASNSVAIQLTGGQATFQMELRVAGSASDYVFASYDPISDGWWRLSLALGGTSWTAATSPDGYVWTDRWTFTPPWTGEAVAVYFQTSTSVTEASGYAAGISHVNTMLSPLNPGWPVTEHAWGPAWGINGGAVPAEQWADMSARSRGGYSAGRGRQYELDQVRAGELSGSWDNRDGSLDPLNTGGPWYGHIAPYQPARVRMQWPPTPNVLTQGQATGGDTGGWSAGAIPSSLAVASVSDASGGSIVATSGAWQGGRVLQFAVPNGTASGVQICGTQQPAGEHGITYSMQMRVRNVTASTSLAVRPYITSTAAGGTVTRTTGAAVTLTGSTSAAWSLVTVTVTLAASAAAMGCGVQVSTTAGATCAVQIDGWQLERGPAPSLFQVPGVWSGVFAGFQERYPQTWTMSGTYGQVAVSGVDTFALLSQRTLRDPATEEICARSPRFLYALGDPDTATTFTDATGTYPAATVVSGKYGAGTITGGTPITATAPTGTYTGSTGTVATVTNPAGSGLSPSAASVISLAAAGITGPATASWTRALAFRRSASGGVYLWSCAAAGPKEQVLSPLLVPHFELTLSGGVVTFTIRTTSSTESIAAGSGLADGNWHLITFGIDGSSLTQYISVDGVRTSAALLGTPTITASNAVVDSVGAYLDSTQSTYLPFAGDMSFVAEFPAVLSAADISTLYAVWKSGAAGDSSDVRYGRVLRWGGYTGTSSLQAGLTTSMSGAVVEGQDVLSALQAVVDTENGAHFVAGDGTVTFRSRGARYNALTPAYVFGEQASAGEIPYEDASFDYDPTHVSNLIAVAQTATGQVFSAQDAASIAAYLPRNLSRSNGSSSALECQDAADYLVSRYKQPAMRLQSIRLHPAANPGLLWPVCLALELGTRVRVKRRPPAPAGTITADCFVESIAWAWDSQNEATLTLQLSPVDLTPYGVFSAWHSTINGSPASGVTTITVNASADTTNPLATQLAAGQQLVLGLGTANQETVTVNSVGATSPGWTTAVLTLTAPTAKAHTSGDVVCEPLPSGVTDPAFYDAGSAFDANVFAY